MPVRLSRGFTLIELLVVIAIIALLASILFPVFSRARENARRARCMSNLKQLSTAVLQYTQDFDEAYPPMYWLQDAYPSMVGAKQKALDTPGRKYTVGYTSGSANQGNWFSWMDAIFPYTKSLDVYDCPSTYFYAASADKYSGYGYSDALSGYKTNEYNNNTWPSKVNDPLKIAAITRPAEVTMLQDYSTYTNAVMGPNLIGIGARSSSDVIRTPHLEGANVAYTDGHVKWRSKAYLAQIGTATTGCNPAVIVATRAMCSRDWNPFIP